MSVRLIRGEGLCLERYHSVLRLRIVVSVLSQGKRVEGVLLEKERENDESDFYSQLLIEEEADDMYANPVGDVLSSDSSISGYWVVDITNQGRGLNIWNVNIISWG